MSWVPPRGDFPALSQRIHGHPLAYLDSAAGALKPNPVIDRVRAYYAEDGVNVHRGVYALAQRSTDAYEGARDRIARWLGPVAREEVVFVRGTTEGLNLVAQSWARPRVGPGDEIVVSELEHHSNIVPWQLVCEQTGATLRVARVDSDGQVSLDAFAAVMNRNTQVVALSHVSNVTGVVLPVRDVADLAHHYRAVVVVDGAQAAPHLPLRLPELGCDFYAFSGHKVYGPTGIGVLWGRRDRLEAMVPYQGGGDMIRRVRFEGTTYNDLPYRFEAGTPNIAGSIGLGAAVDYLERLDRQALLDHEHELGNRMRTALAQLPRLRLLPAPDSALPVVSFTVEGVHPHDLATLLDTLGVAVRSGHHCAQPLMDHFGVAATTRASLGLYNDDSDLQALLQGMEEALRRFTG